MDLYNTQNEVVGEVDLNPQIFAREVNPGLIHQVVVAQLAANRSGTASHKNRALVRGGGTKPWRQKGTGRARVGSNRSPLWRGGGTIFGPIPRSYRQSTPKKMRRQALCQILSDRAKEGRIKIIENLAVEEPKTRLIKEILNQLGLSGKITIVLAEKDQNTYLASRNIPGVLLQTAGLLNVIDIINSDWVVITRDALTALEQRLT